MRIEGAMPLVRKITEDLNEYRSEEDLKYHVSDYLQASVSTSGTSGSSELRSAPAVLPTIQLIALQQHSDVRLLRPD